MGNLLSPALLSIGMSSRQGCPTMLAELSVVEERYHAVMGVLAGAPGDREERLGATQVSVWRSDIGWRGGCAYLSG
jgi:hypothetical protein